MFANYTTSQNAWITTRYLDLGARGSLVNHEDDIKKIDDMIEENPRVLIEDLLGDV